MSYQGSVSSGYGSSSSSDNNYTAEVDKILKNYEFAAKSESVYLLSTQYSISGYEVKCGISPARSFTPAVILSQQFKFSKISFSTYEWQNFISIMTQQMNFFHTGDEFKPDSIPCGDYCTITPLNYDDCKVILVKKHGVEYYMDEEEVSSILEVNNLIIQRISVLENLDFCQYYYNVLDFCKNITSENLSSLQILYAFCSITPNDMLNNALREFVYFYKLKAINDLNK